MASGNRSSGGNHGIVVQNGDFNAGNVAVGDGARAEMNAGSGSRFSIGSRHSGSEENSKVLHALLRELEATLQSAPARRADEADLLATQATQLVKIAVKPEPSRSVLRQIGKGLRETASFLRDSVPETIRITGQIVDVVSKLHGLGL